MNDQREIPYMLKNMPAEFQRVRDLAWSPIDRLANPGPASPYQPDDPAPLPSAYLAAVDDYLRRVDEGEPTGRAHMQAQHPDAPTCHTPGEGRFPCRTCEAP